MITGNRTNYGQAIGILMLTTQFPRVPGDIGNASTFPYPIVYKIIEGATPATIVTGQKPDTVLLDRFIAAAREMVAGGCRAIVTSCGFLVIFQKELAAAIDVPVFSSSLMQLRIVHNMLRPDQKVGIITANSTALTDLHFAGVDAVDVPKVVVGIQDTKLGRVVLNKEFSYEFEEGVRDMTDTAKKLVADHPDVGAIVLECTNMPPFARHVQEATGLPVFDVVTLVDYVYSAVVKKEFRGFM